MANAVLLVQNFFSTVQFADHVLSADEEATDFPASRVGRGSRLASNRWQPTTENAEHWIRVQCDVSREADMIVIDREHNLDGKTVILERSATGSAPWTQVFSITAPSSAGGALSDTNGARNDEGALLKTFAAVSDLYWRIRVPAMGTGLLPLIGGIYLGKAWSLAEPINAPFEDESYELRFDEQLIDTLWLGAGAARSRKLLNLNIELDSDAEYTKYRNNILEHYRRRRPMWVVFDASAGARAALFVIASGTRLGFGLPATWPFRAGVIAGVEHEPAID